MDVTCIDATIWEGGKQMEGSVGRMDATSIDATMICKGKRE